MSHWTKCKVEIKKLDKLFEAAKKLGMSVDHSTKMHAANRHTGEKKVDAVLSLGHDSIGVVKNDQGNYDLMYDTYDWEDEMILAAGHNCEKLTREYAIGVVQDEIDLMGGFISDTEIKANNETHLTVQI